LALPLRVNPAYEGSQRRAIHRATRVALLLVIVLGALFGASQFLLPPLYGESIVTATAEWQSLRL
jgi:uncharacterized membrane protein (DUF4010 family)